MTSTFATVCEFFAKGWNTGLIPLPQRSPRGGLLLTAGSRAPPRRPDAGRANTRQPHGQARAVPLPGWVDVGVPHRRVERGSRLRDAELFGLLARERAGERGAVRARMVGSGEASDHVRARVGAPPRRDPRAPLAGRRNARAQVARPPVARPRRVRRAEVERRPPHDRIWAKDNRRPRRAVPREPLPVRRVARVLPPAAREAARPVEAVG